MTSEVHLQRGAPPSWASPVVKYLEKIVMTYLEALVIALLGSQFFEAADFGILTALAIASIPAAITAVANSMVGARAPESWPPFLLILIRVAQTGVATFAGYLLAIPAFSLDPSIGRAALAAAGTAVLAALKAELASRFVGRRGSPALVPARLDPPPVNVIDVAVAG